MANVRANNGKLFWDFRFQNKRCREYTLLDDTPENRRKMAKILKKIEDDIAAGTFTYRSFFPNSKLAAQFDAPGVAAQASVAVLQSAAVVGAIPAAPPTPLFKEFAETWFADMSVDWRRTYRETVRSILDQHLLPKFGEMGVGSIRREDILAFRTTLSKVPGRKKDGVLSPRRINAITLVLRQVLNEATDRYQSITPISRIKPLKIAKSDVRPFSLEEVKRIIDTVREDFRPYYQTRFFTGMRTSEIDGLKWKYVDFARRLILIRETFVHGVQEEDTKTASSWREIQMSQVVFDALKVQEAATRKLSEFVFCNRDGQPLDTNNVTKRVWYPLLRHLQLEPRNPYQTRHTAATLWLASGENPEWIARQMGHVNTEMLFKVYSRYVPNVTRRDGSAFERLLAGVMGPAEGQGAAAANDPAKEPPKRPDKEAAPPPAPAGDAVPSAASADVTEVAKKGARHG
jgi:integrase